MTRTVAITNRHPRLRFRRADVVRVIHILDESFDQSPLERGLSAEASAKADRRLVNFVRHRIFVTLCGH